ncbi:hypothetical protein [Yersinia alsatica]|uniref:hypothetical protein n=1 Tax=Yersinia alsatica TaxID=2890317 RepID=UPI001F383C22|nr:hypothetical protein [Yersinia alsatica]
MRELTAKVERLEAEAKRINAQAERETNLANGQRFNDTYTQAKMGQVLQGMQNVTEEIGALHEEMMQVIQGQIDQIPL